MIDIIRRIINKNSDKELRDSYEHNLKCLMEVFQTYPEDREELGERSANWTLNLPVYGLTACAAHIELSSEGRAFHEKVIQQVDQLNASEYDELPKDLRNIMMQQTKKALKNIISDYKLIKGEECGLNIIDISRFRKNQERDY